MNDQIEFNHSVGQHNVNVVTNFTSGHAECTAGTPTSTPYDFESPGTYYFYCSILTHCANGMHKTVTVLPLNTTYTDSTAGHYNDAYEQMTRKPCDVGNYQDQVGKTECKPLTTCHAGSYVTNSAFSQLSKVEDRVCQKCAVGRYSTASNSMKCERCSSGNHANDARTGCKEDKHEGLPDWAWIAIGSGTGVILIAAVVIAARMRGSKNVGQSSENDGAASGVYSLIY